MNQGPLDIHTFVTRGHCALFAQFGKHFYDAGVIGLDDVLTRKLVILEAISICWLMDCKTVVLCLSKIY